MSVLVLRALERELLVWRRTWRGSAVTSFVSPALYLGAMGLGLGGLVDANTGPASVDGLGYMEFVAPGLLVATSMMAVSGDGLWGVMAGVKWMGQFRSMVHTAMTPGDVFGGLVLQSGVRGAVSAAVFLVTAAVLGGVTSLLAPLAVVVAAVLGAATKAALSAYAVTKETDDTFPLIVRLGVMPMFLFSGTFFPVGQLPDGIEPLAWLSPLFHAAEAARAATAGGFGLAALGHFGVLVAILVVAVPFGVRNFARRLTP